MRWTAVLIGLVTLLAGAHNAAAAAPGTGDTLVIGGATAECHDTRGRTIPFVKVVNLGDVGRAWIVNRVPVIALDPHLLDRLPDKLQRFFYDHECAHHVLGHWLAFSPDRETDADCWAVKRARDQDQLSRDDVVGFAPFLAQSLGSPWGHLPGPQRIKHLLGCFDQPVGG